MTHRVVVSDPATPLLAGAIGRWQRSIVPALRPPGLTMAGDDGQYGAAPPALGP